MAFAAYRLVTKSNQQKLGSILRIGAFGALAVFALVSIIKWSARWYGLAALLLVWAALGAWTLLGKREEKRAHSTVRTVLGAISALLLVTVAMAPALIFPQHEPLKTTGPYPVAMVNHTYTDPSRIETYAATGAHRSVNVELWYPAGAGYTYPLVVFSHGSTGVKSSNESLYRELASHGYVVASIDHTYQSLYTTSEDGHTTWINMGYFNEIRTEDGHAHKEQSFEYYQKWMKLRTIDIDFVIDHILTQARENNADPVYKLVDPTKIGVMGHSLGGSAALAIGRMRQDVSAVIALESPFLADIEGVQAGEFVWNDATYPIPVLNIYSQSWSHLGEWKQYAENYALLSPSAATAFNVHIAGASHLTLTDLGLTSPSLARLLSGHAATASTEDTLNTVSKVSLEFFNTYLKQQGTFTSGGTY